MVDIRQEIDEAILQLDYEVAAVASLAHQLIPLETYQLRDSVHTLKDLRIAAVVDEATRADLDPECQLLSLDSRTCLDQVHDFQPDILLVEAAWSGWEGTWQNKVCQLDTRLAQLMGYCQGLHVPVVFWNNADPARTAEFLPVAARADFVFTTDGDSVFQYKRVLGHDRVYHLHFGAQPRLANPVEQAARDSGADRLGDDLKQDAQSQSQTAFSRQVFQLMASNQVVVSSYARGLKNYFGDLTICTNWQKTAEEQLSHLRDGDTGDRYRLLGLRKVLSEHLVEDRLDRITKLVFGKALKPALPMVYVVGASAGKAAGQRVQQMFAGQTYARKQLVKISELAAVSDAGTYVAVFAADNYYGPNYLTDLMLSTRYCDADGYCKPASPADSYHFVDEAPLASSAVRLDMAKSVLAAHQPRVTGRLLAIDRFNYLEHSAEQDCTLVDDLAVVDQGLTLDELTSAAPTPPVVEPTDVPLWPLKKLGQNRACLSASRVESGTQVLSRLADGATCYLRATTRLDLADFQWAKRFSVTLCVASDLDLMGVCWFFDGHDAPMGTAFYRPGGREVVPVPNGATCVQFGLRVCGPGTSVVEPVQLSKAAGVPFDRLHTRSDVLVVANHYPSPDDLYKNMFVHRRVERYKDAGLVADVMECGRFTPTRFREFEGINVLDGQSPVLDQVLAGDSVRTVAAHMLNRSIWDAVKPHLSQIRLIIWCHGADIQPWWRRPFNATDKKDQTKQKRLSDSRMTLWREVFAEMATHDIHLVFVSGYFMNEVCTDYQVSLPADKCSTIPNLIDTELYQYVPKSADDRLRLLSIRPYISPKYANDLTVKCILELSKQPWFSQLQFTIIGEGPLYDEINAPLLQFGNVHLEKRFLPQSEIARLHRENGIFLTPTRMDAQGVSRDEAMSSGLVPVTNSVTAIPEFTDDTCAILAPADDYMAMAAGIERLYHDPDLFLSMSANAAARVRSQSDRTHTTDKELLLIRGVH